MARWEREYGRKEQEIANDALREATALQRDAALNSTTKRYGDTLNHMLATMPSESAEQPAYFDTVENVFAVYEVPKNLKAKLILPLLSFRAKSVICRLSAAQMDDYDELKSHLFKLFKTADETKPGCITCCYTTFEVHRPKVITSAWLTFWLSIG